MGPTPKTFLFGYVWIVEGNKVRGKKVKGKKVRRK